MYCPSCGKEVENDAKFCWKCGYELENEKATVFEEKKKEARKKITFVTGLLLALLGLRFIGSSIAFFFGNFFSSIDVIVYLVTIVGVVSKAKWGSILALVYQILGVIFIIIAPLDSTALPFGLADKNAFIAGAIIMNLLIIGLAWKEYSDLKGG